MKIDSIHLTITILYLVMMLLYSFNLDTCVSIRSLKPSAKVYSSVYLYQNMFFILYILYNIFHFPVVVNDKNMVSCKNNF